MFIVIHPHSCTNINNSTNSIHIHPYLVYAFICIHSNRFSYIFSTKGIHVHWQSFVTFKIYLLSTIFPLFVHWYSSTWYFHPWIEWHSLTFILHSFISMFIQVLNDIHPHYSTNNHNSLTFIYMNIHYQF
jgi:hypothetical protein